MGIDLDAIRAREQAATLGPWETGGDGLVWSPGGFDPVSASVNERDAEFIAHARQDIPALIAEIERLRAIVDADRTAEVANAEAASGVNDHVQVVGGIVDGRKTMLAYDRPLKVGGAVELARAYWDDAQSAWFVSSTPSHGVARVNAMSAARWLLEEFATLQLSEAASPLSDHLPTGVDGSAIGTRGGAR